MSELVTPSEIAVELGVDPSAVRRWLSARHASGDPRLTDHVPGSRWRFDRGLAFDLARQFAAEKLGATDEEVRGPHGWRNWYAFEAGRPARTSRKTSTSLVLPSWEEHALYTDAPLSGELSLGPFRLINTLAGDGGARSQARLAVILRASDHLAEPDYASLIDDEDVTAYFGGDLSDEFAALLALCLNRRMRSGGIVRSAFGEPAQPGTPIEYGHRPPVLAAAHGRPLLPGLAAPANLADARVYLEHYRDLDERDATAVVRAARQFADALWLADADPRLAWLKLVGAIESAANSWDAAQHESPIEQLRRHRRRTYQAIRHCGDDVIRRVATDLAGTFKATQKFKDFVLRFDPGPPVQRPEIGRFDWERLDAALGWIYEHRSRELHAGTPFPGPLCEPAPGGEGVPVERFPALAAENQGGRWLAEQLPMYMHTFAHIVGGALRRWWRTLVPSPVDHRPD